MTKPRTMLVVGAHSGDFVWRASGAIATCVQNGGKAHVVAMSYGERGESGALWKEPGQTEENVKRIRYEEVTRAVEHLGASFQGLDLGDYPLKADDNAVEQLVEIIREVQPDVVLTHAALDPFNPDHPVARAAVDRARLLTSGAGVESAFKTVKPTEYLAFEPHQPELCGFTPSVFLDITPVWDKKLAAMHEMGAQKYLQSYYTERGGHRGNHARKVTGNQEIRYAEAFDRIVPNVVTAL
ncbi:MAG: PIG-L deacetylase family protein [Ancrocorticia sp.]|uniref:PIG-L deacetylase family protein n=1 Tax=Ancrocorticia sp. TaxID=2593684 RepID=UPI003F93C879